MRAWILALPLLLLRSAAPGAGTVVASTAAPLLAAPYKIAQGDESAGPSHTLALGRIKKQSLAFVADEDRSAILTFSTDDMRFVSRTQVNGKPSSVRVLPNGELAVTLREQAEVAFLEAAPSGLRVSATVDVCSEPVSTNDDGDALFVVCAWGHALDVVSIAAKARVARFELPREPRAVVAGQDGRLYVSHAVGSRLSVVDRRKGAVSERGLSFDGLGTRDARVDAFFGNLGEGAALSPSTESHRPRLASQGFSLAYLATSTGERIFLPEVLVAPTDAPTMRGAKLEPPPMRSAGYGGGFGGAFAGPRPAAVPYLATLEVGESKATPALPTATGESHCLLPRAAKTTPNGRVFVTCLGSDEVVEYDGLATEPDRKLVLRAHVAHGPTGVAFADMRIFVWSTFDRVLTRLEDGGLDGFAVVSDTTERPPTPFEVGRRLFHRTDSRHISADGRACASCHPDGRDDGLVWSSPDGPRQTPMLAGRLDDTPPFGWTGSAETVRVHLKQTLARLGGQGLDDASLYALLAYLAQMAPPPAPRGDEARVANGKKLFDSYDTGCRDCHDPSRGLSDGARHVVGKKARGDVHAAFETPSLRHVGGTAPYFHDGRFATLEDLLRGSPAMADTSRLSGGEIGDLAAYLRSL